MNMNQCINTFVYCDVGFVLPKHLLRISCRDRYIAIVEHKHLVGIVQL